MPPKLQAMLDPSTILRLLSRPSSQRTNRPTPLGKLGDLPIELRRDIYQYIFNFNKMYLVTCPYKSRKYISADPALLQTSSLIKQEAQEIVYNDSIFRFQFEISMVRRILGLSSRCGITFRPSMLADTRIADFHTQN